MTTFLETFGGSASERGRWTFNLDKRFNGAFGGTNGGVLSAISLYAARGDYARAAASIDSRYMRGFRPGRANIVVAPVNQGRTLTVVSVAVIDDDDRLCTQSTITLVEPGALAVEIAHAGTARLRDGLNTFADGKPWRRPETPMEIPLIDTFQPTALGGGADETVTATKVLWQEPGTYAEAACIGRRHLRRPARGARRQGRRVHAQPRSVAAFHTR